MRSWHLSQTSGSQILSSGRMNSCRTSLQLIKTGCAAPCVKPGRPVPPLATRRSSFCRISSPDSNGHW